MSLSSAVAAVAAELGRNAANSLRRPASCWCQPLARSCRSREATAVEDEAERGLLEGGVVVDGGVRCRVVVVVVAGGGACDAMLAWDMHNRGVVLLKVVVVCVHTGRLCKTGCYCE